MWQAVNIAQRMRYKGGQVICLQSDMDDFKIVSRLEGFPDGTAQEIFFQHGNPS